MVAMERQPKERVKTTRKSWIGTDSATGIKKYHSDMQESTTMLRPLDMACNGSVRVSGEHYFYG